MTTSFSLLILVLLRVNCENDYHNLLHRYHELMNEEISDEYRPALLRENRQESTFVPDASSFHSHPSQPIGVHGGDMRLPLPLLYRLVSEGERRKAMRLSNGELRL